MSQHLPSRGDRSTLSRLLTQQQRETQKGEATSMHSRQTGGHLERNSGAQTENSSPTLGSLGSSAEAQSQDSVGSKRVATGDFNKEMLAVSTFPATRYVRIKASFGVSPKLMRLSWQFIDLLRRIYFMSVSNPHGSSSLWDSTKGKLKKSHRLIYTYHVATDAVCI